MLILSFFAIQMSIRKAFSNNYIVEFKDKSQSTHHLIKLICTRKYIDE